MKSEAEIDNAFAYAKRVGVKTIVGVPNYELLPYVDKKVKEYNFIMQSTCMGQTSPPIPTLQTYGITPICSILVSACAWMWVTICANGCDPVADLKKYHTRVFDVHIKDVTEASKAGKGIEIGRGKIDFRHCYVCCAK
jgi:hypothetical protein